ncbi:SDR family oxidoreductase [Saccharothrix sp. NRRL B-16314]|uniref:SDR family oxidoreductase n=1 Tax=Saccharothrix sp. NRRL B-16314 TaxID=1463825 RepID=UPI000525D850|nr:SDR family oxidoreductase [Saccharothrix sp. NRRL B-16314]
MRLDNRTALVTGGGRGIGRAVSQRLAAEGARVLIHYGRDADAAEATAAAVREAGGQAETLGVPLGEADPEQEAAELWRQVDALVDGVDVLVNNAGIADVRGTIDAIDPAGLNRLWAVNTVAPFFITKHALGRVRDGGRIVNVSAHLTRGATQPDLIAYTMTKAAIDAFTAALAKQLGARGITVNAVAPGVVDTDMNAAWLGYARDMVAGLSPLGRVADATDVADVVAFLASDDSRWVTGQHVDASGGALL